MSGDGLDAPEVTAVREALALMDRQVAALLHPEPLTSVQSDYESATLALFKACVGCLHYLLKDPMVFGLNPEPLIKALKVFDAIAEGESL